MKYRFKVFNAKFLRTHFGEEYKKVTGNDIGKTAGYPDMGNGRYS